jgi:hypothetical protein
VAGVLLSMSSFGWPLLAAGVLKILYDGFFLMAFRQIRPAEEMREADEASKPSNRDPRRKSGAARVLQRQYKENLRTNSTTHNVKATTRLMSKDNHPLQDLSSNFRALNKSLPLAIS